MVAEYPGLPDAASWARPGRYLVQLSNRGRAERDAVRFLRPALADRGGGGGRRRQQLGDILRPGDDHAGAADGPCVRFHRISPRSWL